MKLNDLLETEEYFKPSLYEMSNYSSQDTGLPNGVKLWIRDEPNALSHVKYRIKIGSPQKGSAVFAVWGNEAKQVAGTWDVTGKDLKKVELLVKLTHEQLRDHIDGKISSGELGRIFDSVRKQVEDV